MENLHPVAQVAAIIGIVVVACVYFIAAFTDFFDNIGKR